MLEVVRADESFSVQRGPAPGRASVVVPLSSTSAPGSPSCAARAAWSRRPSTSCEGVCRVGLAWGEEDGEILADPDEAVANAIRSVFQRFLEFGSARKTWLWFLGQELLFPNRSFWTSEIQWLTACVVNPAASSRFGSPAAPAPDAAGLNDSAIRPGMN